LLETRHPNHLIEDFIPDERGRTDPLGPYKNKNMVIKFPITKKGQRSFHDIKWLSVWCRKFAIDFGYVQIPAGVQIPTSTSGGYLNSGDGAAEASNVVMEDADTIVVENLKFDGSVQDAIFVMGIGESDTEGYQVPNERGSIEPLGRYNRRTLTLKIPKVSDNDHVQYFGIWSPTRGMISSVKFPNNMRVPPSSENLR
ncbi:Protein Skeletor, isoforms B/C, partial [Armadillidium vulgare]